MPELDLISIFIVRLNKLGIKYIITGSVASIIYGEPRLTHDVDLIIELNKDDITDFVSAFPLEDFYCPPEEVVNVEINRRLRGHFNLIHHETGFKADIYLSGEDPLHQWALDNGKRAEYEGESLWLAPIEYVIIRKLQYSQEGGSEKHIRDIQSMLEISANQIGYHFLDKKIQELNLETGWRRVKS